VDVDAVAVEEACEGLRVLVESLLFTLLTVDVGRVWTPFAAADLTSTDFVTFKVASGFDDNRSSTALSDLLLVTAEEKFDFCLLPSS
jgi:hypothetical protein